MSHVSGFMCHVSLVMCHVSFVACHVSRVTYHVSLTPTATATDPPPANSPIMHTKLLCKDPKPQKMSKRKKKYVKTAETQKSLDSRLLTLEVCKY